jgi:two-component system NarL family sensor kinase
MESVAGTKPLVPEATGSDRLPEGGPGQARGRGGSPGWLFSARLCWGLAGTALLLSLAIIGIAVADGDLFLIPLIPTPLVAGLMGGLVASRRPGHRMGLLLAGYSFVSAVDMLTFAYGRAAVVAFPGALPFGRAAMWLSAWDYVPDITLGLVLPLVFPDGRLLSPRWRPALWAALAFTVLALAGNAFAPMSMGPFYAGRQNPYAVSGPLFGLLIVVGSAFGLAVAVAAVASIAVRWRRAGHVERQQLKWLLAIVPFNVVSAATSQFFPNAPVLILVSAGLSGLVLAVGLGLSVLRYRLYGIDILVSRALVYGLLTAAVAGVYLVAVTLAGIPFDPGRGLSVPVLVTVLAAAVLLPVLGRLQRRVDRVFFGDRGAPYTAMARLGHQVEDAASAEPVLGSVASVVASSLRLPYAAVELRVGDEWIPAAACGLPLTEVVRFPLTFQREAVGRLTVGQRAPGEKLSPDDERLLGNLARQVAPAAHAVALRQALDASRAGLAAAREEERQRLRRDLHDGLGPTVAGLGLGLDVARTLAAGQGDLEDLLSRLKTETQHAVGEIRRLVNGLRPSALDQLGLAEALREEMIRLEYQVPELSVTLRLPDQDLAALPAAIEVAVYRIVTEAVTNVVRHAGARHADVSVAVTAREVRLAVGDDGDGMPEGWRAGVGITAMRERAAELGGHVAIEPRSPLGTRITAWLPLSRLR